MIYEHLPVKTTHHEFEVYRSRTSHDDPSGSVQLVWKTLSGLEILATCRQINAEATAIIQRRLESLKQEPVRLIARLSLPSANPAHELLQVILPQVLFLSRCARAGITDLRSSVCPRYWAKNDYLPTSDNSHDLDDASRGDVQVAIDMSRIAADRYNQLTPHLMYIISNKEARFRIIDAEVRHVHTRMAMESLEEELYPTALIRRVNAMDMWQETQQPATRVGMTGTITIGEWDEVWAKGEKYI
jgi:hypothetical protein